MFNKSTAELILPCSVDELCNRLNSEMDKSYFGTRPVIGRVRGAKLTARRRIWYRNSFQTYLFAKLSDHGNETLVRCTFSMHPIVIGFSGVALLGGAIFVHSLSALVWTSARTDGGDIAGVAIPVLMLVFGTGLVAFGRWLARDETAFLLNFVSSQRKDGSAGAA